MTATAKLEVTGPHSRCATEYGYGDYYTVVVAGVEWAHAKVAKGTPLGTADRRRLLAAARRAIRSDWESRGYTSLKFPGYVEAAGG